MTRILVVDNYDSFVYTIVGYLDQLGAATVVVRNDAVPGVAERAGCDGVLISPGPGTPRSAGQSLQVIRDCAHARELMHGKTSHVVHDGAGVLAGLPTPFTATRYHSLAVVDGTVPDELVVTARVEVGAGGAPGVIMGLQHRELPLHGVQFHPESVLTEGGHRLLANWLEICGLDGAVARSAGMAPLVRATAHA